MPTSQTQKTRATKLTHFLGLQRSTIGLLAMVVLVGMGERMAGFALVILVPTWQAVLAGAVLFISWSAISLPATMSLIYKVLPQNKRTMGVSMHSLVWRIPMALGPLQCHGLKKKPALILFVYPDKRCERCENGSPVARTVSRHGRNETATLLHNLAGPGIKNNMVPLQFSGDQES